jgi:hypothetical protein
MASSKRSPPDYPDRPSNNHELLNLAIDKIERLENAVYGLHGRLSSLEARAVGISAAVALIVAVIITLLTKGA